MRKLMDRLWSLFVWAVLVVFIDAVLTYLYVAVLGVAVEVNPFTVFIVGKFGWGSLFMLRSIVFPIALAIMVLISLRSRGSSLYRFTYYFTLVVCIVYSSALFIHLMQIALYSLQRT